MTATTGTRIFKSGASFFLENFWGIILAAAIPALIGIALSLMAGHAQMQTIISQLQQGVPDQQVNPFSGKFVLLLLLAWIVGLWFSVRVYRYRLASEFPVTGSEFSCVLWMAGYMLALFFLLVVIVFVFVLAVVLTVTLIAIALGMNPQAGAADPRMIILGFLVMLAVIPAYIYLIYVAIRFSIALPGVAIGRRENIFHTMWPMGRGVALPLLGWFLLVGIAAVALFVLILWMTVGFSAIIPGPGRNAQMLQEPDAFFRTQLIMGVVLAFPNVVFRAFGATVFAEAYAQMNRGKLDAAF
jgi:hypothetical protein